MIFSQKHGMYTAVLLGKKTLTTRINLPKHIEKGKVWAIVPGRAKPAWWLDDRPGNPPFRNLDSRPPIVTNPRAILRESGALELDASSQLVGNIMFALGYEQAAICIEDYYPSPLGDMDDRDARDEGLMDMAGFIRVWNAINPKTPFADNMNMQVWRIAFSREDIIRAAVERIGRDAILRAAGMTDPEPTP